MRKMLRRMTTSKMEKLRTKMVKEKKTRDSITIEPIDAEKITSKIKTIMTEMMSREKKTIRKKRKLKTSLARIEREDKAATRIAEMKIMTKRKPRRRKRRMLQLSTSHFNLRESGEASMTNTKQLSGDTLADLLLLWIPLCHLNQRLSCKPLTMSLTTSSRQSTTSKLNSLTNKSKGKDLSLSHS